MKKGYYSYIGGSTEAFPLKSSVLPRAVLKSCRREETMSSISAKKEPFTNEKSEQRNALICQHLTLVPAVASKYHGLDNWDELISVGTIGLIKAVDTFDHRKGCSLTSYAWICITNEINMYLRKELTYRNRIAGSAAAGSSCISGSTGLEKQDPVFEEVSNKIECEQLIASFCSLSVQEQQVLRLRFGLNDAQTIYSQEEIADRLGFSQSYTSRIVRKCLLALQQKLTSAGSA